MRRSRSRPDDRPAKLLPFGVSANHHGSKGRKNNGLFIAMAFLSVQHFLVLKCAAFSASALIRRTYPLRSDHRNERRETDQQQGDARGAFQETGQMG